MQQPPVDLRELRAQLARRDIRQWRLAADMNVSPSTLSAYLRGHCRAPRDLRQQIERVLGLEQNALAHK
jgi:hypothetical protein